MSIAKKFVNLSKGKKIQVVIASILTVCAFAAAPVYAWFRWQQQAARYDKISSPNSLYICAARREDAKYFDIGRVDVKAYWKDSNQVAQQRATYQDYVFSVAGDYVTSYSLQLAHTTNNNYTYTIYRADVTNENPASDTKYLGRDFIEYDIHNSFDPAEIADIAESPVYEDLETGDSLYYYVKKDDNSTLISLNATDPTESDTSKVIPSTYTIGGKKVKYNGHYLNWNSEFQANTAGKYHIATYEGGENGYSAVNPHAEPLYWQATGIQGGNAVNRNSFYHEYILRVSWTNDGVNQATSTYKDTDVIYITVSADNG